MKRLILMLFMANTTYAGEGTFVKYMVSATGDYQDQKGLAIGKQSEWYFLDTKLEGGYIFDNHRQPTGTKDTAFGLASIGLEPTAGPLYIHFFQGAGLISTPDSLLGGRFQFFEDVGVGLRDQEKDISVGLHYKHISSAGLYKPNKGRDMIGFQLMVPF